MSNELNPSPPAKQDPQAMKNALFQHLLQRKPNALETALPVLNAISREPDVLLLTIIAALLDQRPEHALRYLQRFTKGWRALGHEDQLLRVIALALQEHWAQAAQVMQQVGRNNLYPAFMNLPGNWNWRDWAHDWLQQIERHEYQRQRALQAEARAAAKAALKKAQTDKPKKTPTKVAKGKKAKVEETPVEPPRLAELPRYDIRIPLDVVMPEHLESALAGAQVHYGVNTEAEREGFRLRYELAQLGLFQGFDELLCLPTLHDIETYWYQLETVRKVLKQFRGRVLLADEVGLGKTIEAGMVFKEYLLRGMAERVLVLTPATLVGQWQEEMATKFGIELATTYDNLLRSNPEKFWAQPRVIASIATARRAEHVALLERQHYDLVIVDEAHHLKNRVTANWKLVNALNKRFLLLLSATPVQNSLVELYNLLTLLKPGIFKTEKEFRESYMTSGKPRVPANKEKMRDLMRDVMIRNTRSLVDVKLPPRHAMTMRLDATATERECYDELSGLVAELHAKASSQQRLSMRHLLSAAGSTPATAANALTRYLSNHRAGSAWHELRDRYEGIRAGSKERELLELLEQNPQEKKMVFVHHRETLVRLAELAGDARIPCVLFEGGMTGMEKDAAVERFRDDIPLLLCTESGGEGRNLQFCNTLINFDLPWNPMAIEQRIGRIHRIGQTRDVFVFNLAVRDTLEDQMLRILDEKINMFELVVGEIDAILGEMSDESDFAELVFAAWVGADANERAEAFEQLGDRMVEAKQQYNAVKAFDEELFGEEFVTG
jgi:superfamily II DNA or RNA helicase